MDNGASESNSVEQVFSVTPPVGTEPLQRRSASGANKVVVIDSFCCNQNELRLAFCRWFHLLLLIPKEC